MRRVHRNLQPGSEPPTANQNITRFAGHKQHDLLTVINVNLKFLRLEGVDIAWLSLLTTENVHKCNTLFGEAMPRRRRNQPRVRDHHHAVKFYADTNSLFTTVAAFLGQGFVDDHPAIIIATPAHTMAIIEHMRQLPVDVELAQGAGTLVLLDAEKTLASFMVGDTPDPDRFERNVGQLIRDLVAVHTGESQIRAYGEMVDVLWKEGRAEAAIRLEILWNGLASRFGFALLCGYAMGNFYKQAHLVEEICRQHTHVLAPVVLTAIPP